MVMISPRFGTCTQQRANQCAQKYDSGLKILKCGTGITGFGFEAGRKYPERASLDILNARGITSSGRARRIFGLGERATCYLFREWAEEPLDWPRARSGTASMARFARTRRRSSTYRGTSTTKNSPFASEKFARATPGSSLEIRVSADLASNRWTCLCVGIRLPSAWGIAADVTA